MRDPFPSRKTRLEKLTKAIERDLLAERPRSAPTPTCFACGRDYTPKPPTGDDSTRFCRDRCRAAYDAGIPSKANLRWHSLPMGRHGFLVGCAGCGKRFDSKGFRCCSIACERQFGERREIDRLKAEAGVDFVSKLGPKRKCEAAGCSNDIPRWRNGRQVSKATRFCSRRCARMGSDEPHADLGAETAKKCP